jgi:hypothetical protein
MAGTPQQLKPITVGEFIRAIFNSDRTMSVPGRYFKSLGLNREAY